MSGPQLQWITNLEVLDVEPQMITIERSRPSQSFLDAMHVLNDGSE
jgi:hypothetical protein